MAIDFEKAFDSIRHDYLLKVLQKFRFPIKFINLVKQFLNIGKSCLCIDFNYTKSFKITRGVRQGEPLSGLLFVIAIEPLLCTLIRLKPAFAPTIKSYLISHTAFADELTIFIRLTKKKIEYDSKSPPRSKTFKKLLKFKPPQLHETPLNMPNLSDWPTISKLHIPPTTKSFLLKLFMNALPTHNRMAHFSSKNNPVQFAKRTLHQSTSSMVTAPKTYSTKIMQLFDDNWVARPTRRITFDNNINLILMNVLWKTFCKARHSDPPVCALQESALISFIHDLQVSQFLYPKDSNPEKLTSAFYA